MPETLQDIEKDFTERFGELEERFKDVTSGLEGADSKEERESLSKALEDVQEQVAALNAEREQRLEQHEKDSLKGRVETLEKALEHAREPMGEFTLAGGVPAGEQEATYGDGGERSFFNDARAVFQDSDPQARERWEGALGKAMTEGTGSAGGFLVPDQISSELIQLRLQDAVLRPLFSNVQVNSDTFRIAQVTGGLTAGWVAELATKPAADMTFAELSINTFTAAGTAVTSNQLLRDSARNGRSIDALVNADLARRLRNLEEVAFINGSGTGQPLGILNTSGINAITYTDATPTVPELLDAITDAITAVYTNYFGAPNAIVMHPRTWAFIVKAREAASPTTYIVGPPGGVGRRPQESLPGYGAGQTPRGELFGLPVYTTANIPTNLGVGVNESRIIVGNFSEGLILDHEGIQLAQSPHVFFTSNQTVFRAEEQVGFTAARYPKAFSVVGGNGLAGV